MAVGSVGDIDVEAEATVSCETAEHFLEALDVEVSDLVGAVADVVNAAAAAGDIHGNIGQGLFHRDGAVSVAGDSLFISERFQQALSDAYTDIFGGVVCVNVEVAFGPEFEVEFPMFAEVCKHMVEKTHTGLDAVAACTIKVKGALDVGFFCLSVHCRGSVFHRDILILIER